MNQIYFANSEKYILECEINTFYLLTNYILLASTICSTLEKQLSPLLSCTRSSRRCRGQMIFQIVFSFFFHTFFSSCIKSRICDPHVIFGNHSKEWNANQPPLLSIKTVSVGICARIIRPTVRLSKRGFVSISQLLLGCQIKYRRARQRIGNCANIYFRRISSH